MGNFLAEVKRRHIYRVAAAYAVVAWALLQLFNNLTPVMKLPDWAGTFVLVVLAGGFPIALFFAWIRELPAADFISPAKTKITDWAMIGILFAVLAAITYQQFAPAQTNVAGTQQNGVEAARSAAAKPAGISLAVLPFVNLSSDKEQEFFSDGMTEEITAALAKVPDLKVVARTSAFEFKGKNSNIKTMGEQLGATHLIEGSVRKAGDKLRITVQLIKADDGTHLWAEDYDRQLTDIFQIQEDIARAITASLRMPLGLKPGENLVNNRSIDPQSYQEFLRAKALYNARGLENVQNAIGLLKQIIAVNPAYAPAWAVLARAYTTLPNYSTAFQAIVPRLEDLKREVQFSRDNAEPAARKAIELDPSLAVGYDALGFLQRRAGKFVLAEDSYAKAIALDPNSADALIQYSGLLTSVARMKDAVALMQRGLALEPLTLIPAIQRNLAIRLWLNGDDEHALTILRSFDPAKLDDSFLILIVMVQAGAGHFKEAADTVAGAAANSGQLQAIQKEAVRLLRIAPDDAALQDPPVALGFADFIYNYVGAPERVLAYYEHNVEAGWMENVRTPLLWHTSYTPVRKLERFKAYVRKAGFLDYWRAKGWPEFCRPTTGDDFVCN